MIPPGTTLWILMCVAKAKWPYILENVFHTYKWPCESVSNPYRSIDMPLHPALSCFLNDDGHINVFPHLKQVLIPFTHPCLCSLSAISLGMYVLHRVHLYGEVASWSFLCLSCADLDWKCFPHWMQL